MTDAASGPDDRCARGRVMLAAAAAGGPAPLTRGLRAKVEAPRPQREARPAERGDLASSQKWLGLGALALVSFLLTLDDTALSVALPSIGRDLGLGLSSLEWVVTAYTLALAALLLPGGRLADALEAGGSSSGASPSSAVPRSRPGSRPAGCC